MKNFYNCAMIVHICCSVDSWYFLTRLKEKYPFERLIGFFYNPNICPRSEYLSRMIDAKRCCDRLGIDFLEGEYDMDAFAKAARGLENEPEKGARCATCFEMRLERTAKEAARLGEKRFTTTLLMSPKKDLRQLEVVSKEIARARDLKFVFEDFRKGGGTQAAFALAREKDAYFQNYCGCAWGLIKQRDAQGKIAVELICSIDGAKNAATAADLRLKAICERARRENEGEKTRLYKTKIMEWRLLSGGLTYGQTPIACDIAPYSASLAIKSRLVGVGKGVARFEKAAGFVVARSVADSANVRAVLRATLGLGGDSDSGLGNVDITPIFVVDDLTLSDLMLESVKNADNAACGSTTVASGDLSYDMSSLVSNAVITATIVSAFCEAESLATEFATGVNS
ncbi:MAG: epoxyqueuosine reductase QueH [Helicobacteraceae bacterium]|nr:epoxyqueuosine reductase QueH [Helicobacteraceae bacterium]